MEDRATSRSRSEPEENLVEEEEDAAERERRERESEKSKKINGDWRVQRKKEGERREEKWGCDRRSCICAPGYEWENHYDWTQGCKPKFKSFRDSKVEATFVNLPHSDFYGYDTGCFKNLTLETCKKLCLDLCNCLGLQYKFSTCYPKLLLLNGHYSPGIDGGIHFKLPKFNLSSNDIPKIEHASLQCTAKEIMLPRTYLKRQESTVVNILLIFAGAIAGLEALGVLVVFCFSYRTHPEKRGAHNDGHHAGPTGFRQFTYDELKKATGNFSEEIGRGSGGIVYKAVLLDCRVAAVKRLNEVNQGEDEFLAEVSTIGNLHHMNLIEMWGYCAEGKHRLLIYEFMEHGSLAENLSSPTELDWSKRFEIAVGARGVAYLHEECLEWVLHCDVKPQNILLDSTYQPKVADFGLSKILKREGLKNSSFSRIRGTRGYMAPEWIYNFPITSKVDVYSYGIVLLEMVTGRSPAGEYDNIEGSDLRENKILTSWVREKKGLGVPMQTWIEEIVDPSIRGEYDIRKIEILVAVALKCVEEDRDARPTMSQVVEMLLRCEDEDV